MDRKMKLGLSIVPIFLLLVLVLILQNEETPSETRLLDNNIESNSRLLGIDINEAPHHDYTTSVAEVKGFGIDFTTLTLFWDILEPIPNQYNDELLELINVYYPSEGLSLVLTINPIDTNKSRVVSDLSKESLDDPKTISRFNKMIDHVYEKIPNVKLTALAIGNEIDGYLGTNNNWKEYEKFYSKVTEHIKTKDRWKDIPVGTKTMFYGLIEKYSEEISSINQYSDVIMVTYYPLNPDFTFRDPTDIHTDIDLVVQQANGKPIFFLEMGYASGSIVNSSLDKQKEFVIQVFKAWDKNIDHIKAINFVWMYDIGEEGTAEYSRYYGTSDEKFLDFLDTLGLKHNDGKPKPAWIALKDESSKRGWG